MTVPSQNRSYRLALWLRATVILLCILFCQRQVQAQEDFRFDVGGGIGMTGYLGDANDGNLYSHPGWDVEAMLRYIANPRIAFKTNIFAGGLSGDSSSIENVLPAEAQPLKFSTTFFELSELFEFNFFSYGIGESYRKLKRWTPYICGGLGVTVWDASGFGAAFTIPFGVGVKYKLSRRWNLGLEFLMKKTFTDRLDDPALKDPYAFKSSLMKNTDWYSTLTLTISYEFSKRCAVCNYKD